MYDQEFEYLLSRTEELIDKNDTALLRELVADLHAADIARLLEHLHGDAKRLAFNQLDKEMEHEVFVELSDISRQEILEAMVPNDVAAIVDELPSDEATDIVADLPESVADFVLDKIDDQDSKEVRALLKYPEDTAGGIMQLELAVAHDSDTVSKIIEKMRKKREEVEQLSNIFVVDDQERLVGFLPLSSLIFLQPEQKISEVMEQCPVVFNVHEDQEEVANKFRRYDVYTAPVVDNGNKLIGRVTADDIFDVVFEEASEDFLKLAGTRDEEIIYGSKIFKISSLRLPWLVTNLFGGLLTGYLMWLFKLTLKDVIALIAFIPVITAMGGNVGIQSSTIMVRGFAVGRITSSDLGRILFKEFRVALLMGLICGSVVGIVAALWHLEPILGVIVGLAMSLSILAASIMGTLTPVFFKRINVDPALASGPFVTTANDIVGILIYLSIATAFLKQLVH